MGKKILVVDDEVKITNGIAMLLETEGSYEVITCNDGEEALSIIKDELPDLVILDLMMPGIDGFQVCQFIKKKYKMPIIVLTARDDKGTVEMTKEWYKPDLYITKPFENEDLVKAVKKALNELTAEEAE